jgi:Zn-dependent protease/CBS domain-containing protein
MGLREVVIVLAGAFDRESATNSFLLPLPDSGDARTVISSGSVPSKHGYLYSLLIAKGGIRGINDHHMKSWSFKVATIAGTEVRIHATFLVLVFFVGWSGAMSGGLEPALNAMAFLLAMFFCVLLHEFGHVLAAKHYGIPTPDITLLPIGGVARLQRMPRDPFEELVVAVCGPLVNIVIAGAIWLFLGALPASGLEMDIVNGGLLPKIMVWNLWMVIFNMIPAFPMDGGRVLRAILAMMTGYGNATRMAASIGQGIATLGFIVALIWLHNPILLIIAVFIFMSAGQEAAMVSDQEATSGLRVRDAMLTDFHVLREDSVLREAVDLMLAGTQHDFPVVDAGGGFIGLLTRTGLIGALAAHGAQHSVISVMDQCETRLDPKIDLSSALEVLRGSPSPALPVIEPASQRLVGLLTPENVSELVLVRAAMAGTRA